jgi:phosphomannomutase / phosphoglucomutase
MVRQAHHERSRRVHRNGTIKIQIPFVLSLSKETNVKDFRVKETIFREYDIRGIVGTELMIEDVYDLGRAIAFYLLQLNNNVKKIAVGIDVREHSPIIKERLCKALMDSGMEVVFIGVCTSPMMYFATYTMPVDAGIMVTASHNPKEYNGFKICLGTQSLWGNQIREIGKLYREKQHCIAQTSGTYTEHFIKDEYIAWHVGKFAHLKNSDLSAVIDCGNGAAAVVIPDIIAAMGWNNMQLLCCVPDLASATHAADPTVAKNMQDVKQALENTQAIVGIGFDGDADRMGAMTKEGELVAGDKLIALFAQPMIKEHPGMCVVYNVVCSEGLTEVLESWGAKTVITPVGHSVIEENMHKYHALLAGETSCHFFFKDRHFGYDDGVYAMFRLIEILVKSQQPLSVLLEMFPQKVTSPEYRLPCDEESKYTMVQEMKGLFFQKKNVKILAIDGVRVTTDYGWGIIRASNTQPVLSIRFEANTEKDLQRIKEEFISVLAHYFGDEYLREHLQM